MELLQVLFTGFIDIVLHVINNSGYLVYLILIAFIVPLIAVLIYAIIRGLSDV